MALPADKSADVQTYIKPRLHSRYGGGKITNSAHVEVRLYCTNVEYRIGECAAFRMFEILS